MVMFKVARFSSVMRRCCLLGLLSLHGMAAPPLPAPGQPPPTYTLNDCLQLALERNPSILKAQREIERTQGLIITAKATLYPQVTMSGLAEKRNDDLFAQGNYKPIQRFRDYWTIQLAVTQSIYSGGANRQQIAIAKLQHEASLIQFQATIDQMLRDVKYAAYTIVVNRAQIDADNQTVALLTKEEARQKELFDAGRTTRFNILRTEVNLGNQLAALHQTENDLVSSEIALTQLLSIEWPRARSPFDPPFQIHVDLDCPPVGQIKVADFVALALERRPELQVLDRQIDVAERQVKIDKAALLPRIYLYAADEDATNLGDTMSDRGINDYAAGLLGSWNVFDGFASKGQVMSDTATLGSTYVSRDALHLQVQNEVREAYARLLNAQASIQSQTANVKTAEESVSLAQLSAETGYATLLDVLQATIDLTSARTEEIKTKQLYMNAMADLERAVSLKFVDWPQDKDLPPITPPAQPEALPAPIPGSPTISPPGPTPPATLPNAPPGSTPVPSR